MYDDINDKWEFFHGILKYTLQSFALLKKVHSKKSKRSTPWISDSILEKIKLKNKAKQISERIGNPADIDFYK